MSHNVILFIFVFSDVTGNLGFHLLPYDVMWCDSRWQPTIEAVRPSTLLLSD